MDYDYITNQLEYHLQSAPRKDTWAIIYAILISSNRSNDKLVINMAHLYILISHLLDRYNLHPILHHLYLTLPHIDGVFYHEY